MRRLGDVVGGRYRLLRVVGEGGMSAVYHARHELLGRDVALKLSPASKDQQIVGRFLREAEIASRFDHPNIVKVVDAGALEEERTLFLAMELLRGESFAERVAPAEPLDPKSVLPVLIQVCRGLEVAHAAGVVHRDIKPENIFLAVQGEEQIAKIVDFGISRMDHARTRNLTVEGQLLGTPAYMSPEQALGKQDVTFAADIWAVGVILFEALLGRQPFVAPSQVAVLRAIVDEPAPQMPAHIDARLRAIVERCLQKRPADRFASARELREALERALDRLEHGDTRETIEPPQKLLEATEPAFPMGEARSAIARRDEENQAAAQAARAAATRSKKRALTFALAAAAALACGGATMAVPRGAERADHTDAPAVNDAPEDRAQASEPAPLADARMDARRDEPARDVVTRDAFASREDEHPRDEAKRLQNKPRWKGLTRVHSPGF